jgi:hypothetical protein
MSTVAIQISAQTFLWWDANEWQAIAAVATALLTAGLLGYAVVQVGHAKQLRLDQARPFVIVDVNFRSIIIELTIENTGATAATDVRVTFDEPPIATKGEPAWLQSTAFRSGIPMMAPNRRIRWFLDSYVARKEAELPMQITGTVSYAGPSNERYTDRFIVDLLVYAQAAVNEKGVPEMAKALEDMNRRFDKWTGGSNGLLIKSTNHDRAVNRESRSMHVTRSLEARTSGGWKKFFTYWIRSWQERLGLQKW